MLRRRGPVVLLRGEVFEGTAALFLLGDEVSWKVFDGDRVWAPALELIESVLQGRVGYGFVEVCDADDQKFGRPWPAATQFHDR